MAKITVTTDDGEVMEQFKDETSAAEDGDIGNLDMMMARSSLMHEIAAAVARARKQEGRGPNGSK